MEYICRVDSLKKSAFHLLFDFLLNHRKKRELHPISPSFIVKVSKCAVATRLCAFVSRISNRFPNPAASPPPAKAGVLGPEPVNHSNSQPLVPLSSLQPIKEKKERERKKTPGYHGAGSGSRSVRFRPVAWLCSGSGSGSGSGTPLPHESLVLE